MSFKVASSSQRHANKSGAPVWQGETAQMKWRGKLIVIELILNIAGFSLR